MLELHVEVEVERNEYFLKVFEWKDNKSTGML